ncbi:hypothetical protein MMPV_001225 [Pyropia vietnamensis]
MAHIVFTKELPPPHMPATEMVATELPSPGRTPASSPRQNSVDEDTEDFFEPTLFLNEDYTPHTVAITPGCSVTLLALNTAATDVDLTGTVIWPASILLSRWLLHVAAGGDPSGGDGPGSGNGDANGISNGDGDGDGGDGSDGGGRSPLSPTRWMAGSLALPPAPRFLELGAGAGLAGLVAAAAFPGATTLLTDGSTVVMRLLEANVAHFSAAPPVLRATPGAATSASGGGGGVRRPPNADGEPLRTPSPTAAADVRACRLRWDEPAEATAAVAAAGGPPHLLLGADVIQWPRFISPLVTTVATLLANAPPPAAFVCAFVHRSSGCRAAYMTAAAEAGLVVSRVGAGEVDRLAKGLGADAVDMEIWVTTRGKRGGSRGQPPP